MYSPQLLDHFEHPRNAGSLAHADARVRVENPACGDILELSIKVNGGRISDVRFLAKGCVPGDGVWFLDYRDGRGEDASRSQLHRERSGGGEDRRVAVSFGTCGATGNRRVEGGGGEVNMSTAPALECTRFS